MVYTNGWLIGNDCCDCLCVFYCTPVGQEQLTKYKRCCRETDESLNDGVNFCRFYIECFGRPPASSDEIVKFQMNRIGKNPYGRNVPYWNGKDGFGHDVKIQLNEHTRKIRLVSPGLLPFSGDIPFFFDYILETSY